MPQMSPMSWFYLFFYFMLIFYLFLSCLYFYNYYFFNFKVSSKNKVMNNFLSFKW
uniref:ATP synthase complex subunit 8 n=1 Tax=Encyrtus eulecaniumiae TaxID=1914888 RepID=A0A7S5FJW9_9HYME|nr:ATP synthase F0 subunit 8 [Encyrtus eulecaniumiae]QGA74466.1 ATP synthase F0 subunit 8 [Encyrtus eulecaniumiae]QGA74479.1 ATP synthase F0 subunit 8 [Encyrtus eulecaniumiae]QGA74492.1 ATP synthase F0 subunit 8 [Encyrtus eulecaniumiae]QGA74505.1 ATP synthase F0 subunit 8 [Encyrtus eulecaniumiae]